MHHLLPSKLSFEVAPIILFQSLIFLVKITDSIGLMLSRLFWTLVARIGLKVVIIDLKGLELLG